MPIIAGNIAGLGASSRSVSRSAPMISDGKRMRLIWQEGDGDGDPDVSIVDRSQSTLKGHPTWKLFCSDLPFSIERGSTDEPPHYVYLEDRACYAVFCSKAYTNEELRIFWPFDFNHQGHIKMGRKNRGRPAFLDDSSQEYAKAPLRSKTNKWYEFVGAPKFTDYSPLRPAKRSRLEEQVATEYAEEICRGVHLKNIYRSILEDSSKNTTEITPANETKEITGASSANEGKYHLGLLRATSCAAASRVDTHADSLLRYPTKSRLESQSLSSRPVSNSSSAQAATSGSSVAPRQSSTAISSANPKRNLSQAFFYPPTPANDSSSPNRTYNVPTEVKVLGDVKGIATTTPKQTLVQSFDVSSFKPSPATPSPRGCKTKEPPKSDTPSKPCSLGCDGANDEPAGPESVKYVSNEERLLTIYLRNQVVELGAQLKEAQAGVKDLQWDKKALESHVRGIQKERDVYRKIIVMLVASNAAQHKDLSDRVIALQKTSDDARDVMKYAHAWEETVKKRIPPTKNLCEGIGTVLDGPGKYMYALGRDEEWAAIQEEARKLNEEKENPHYLSSSQNRPWNFS